jgi:hypothetical protein
MRRFCIYRVLAATSLLAVCCAKGESLDQVDVKALDCRSECEQWAAKLFATCISDGNVEAQCTSELEFRQGQCDGLSLADCTDGVQALFAEPRPAACDLDELEQSHCEGDTIVGSCRNGRRLSVTCDDTRCSGSDVSLGCRLDADERAYCDCADAPCEPGHRYCDGASLMECLYSGRYLATACSDTSCIAAGYGLFDSCGDDGAGSVTCMCEASITPVGACTDGATQCLGDANVAICYEAVWTTSSCEYYCGWQGFASLGCSGGACQCDTGARRDYACDMGARAYCACNPEDCSDVILFSNCYRDTQGVKAPLQCYGAHVAEAEDGELQVDCDGAAADCLVTIESVEE